MKWNYPLDPDCDGTRQIEADIQCMNDDPMTVAMGAPVDEFAENWEKQHRASCTRCQKYGAAHAEVI